MCTRARRKVPPAQSALQSTKAGCCHCLCCRLRLLLVVNNAAKGSVSADSAGGAGGLQGECGVQTMSGHWSSGAGVYYVQTCGFQRRLLKWPTLMVPSLQADPCSVQALEAATVQLELRSAAWPCRSFASTASESAASKASRASKATAEDPGPSDAQAAAGSSSGSSAEAQVADAAQGAPDEASSSGRTETGGAAGSRGGAQYHDLSADELGDLLAEKQAALDALEDRVRRPARRLVADLAACRAGTHHLQCR